MRTINHFLLMACLSTSMPILAAEPTAGSPTNEPPHAPATTIQSSTGQLPPALAAAPVLDLATNSVAGTNAMAVPAMPPVVVENGTNGLRMNFNKAPLNLVLDYLSDAAGFVINKEIGRASCRERV